MELPRAGGPKYDQGTMATWTSQPYNDRESVRDDGIRVGGAFMARRATVAWRLLVIAILGFTTPAPAITLDEFRLRSGADVVALCSTPASDPLYTAAVHMCHGFGAGAYQTIMAMTRHEKLKAVVCPPDPPPSRNEAVRLFVQWANDNPRYQAEPAVDFVGRFFLAQFPCNPK